MLARMNRTDLLSPAKINLHLRVAGPTPDGFHPLRSWMVGIGLFDKLSFAIESAEGSDGAVATDARVLEPAPLPAGQSARQSAGSKLVRLSCDDPAIPLDGSNLITKAVGLLFDAAPDRWPAGRRVAIELLKQIPTGGGLGGGSGNAAVALRAVNDLLSLGLSRVQLLQLCKRVGSDVAFFLEAGSAIVSGVGGIIDPCPKPAATHALLAFPAFGVSTKACYQRLDELRPVAPDSTLDSFDVQAWSTLPANQLLAKLVNDLEPPAFSLEPQLGRLRSDLEQRLGQTVRMSGSGSTLFTLYNASEHRIALEHARQLSSTIRCEVVELCPA
jgi:4-diphosphocytidyl-2-C-methyl-D-erythritol kinase